MQPTFPGLRPQSSLPTSWATEDRQRRLKQGSNAALATPRACIKRQRHDVRAVGFARHQLPRPAAGQRNLVQHARGRRPPHEITTGSE